MSWPAPTRRQVIERDSDAYGTPTCQWCGGAVRIPGEYSIQHRRARGMGGSSRTETSQAANGLLVHGTGTTGCHGHIERNPEEATRRGFRLYQNDTPAGHPFIDWLGREWVLHNDGTKTLKR